jgi:hypothetical protein
MSYATNELGSAYFACASSTGRSSYSTNGIDFYTPLKLPIELELTVTISCPKAKLLKTV